MYTGHTAPPRGVSGGGRLSVSRLARARRALGLARAVALAAARWRGSWVWERVSHLLATSYKH